MLLCGLAWQARLFCIHVFDSLQYVMNVEADFLCTKMAENINNKMEHRMIKDQRLVLLASIEVTNEIVRRLSK